MAERIAADVGDREPLFRILAADRIVGVLGQLKRDSIFHTRRAATA